MKKSRHTKRALLLSLLSMLICMAMLAGSTFAWFTDSVSTGLNKIVAGNLDVEMKYSTDMETWTEVGQSTKLFGEEDKLWEPGHTEVVYLKVSNEGTLALKYELGVNVAGKTIGRTAAGDEIDLSQYIKAGIAETNVKFENRAAACAAVEASAQWISVGDRKEGHLAAGTTGNTQTLALVVYMPENVGNAANHDGVHIPEIQMGVNLIAAQDTVEKDSFDEKYDQYATYPDAIPVGSVAELSEAIGEAEEGAVIALTADMALTDPITIGKAVTINGNGNEISGKPITATADVTFENLSLVKPVNAGNNASLFYAGAGCENIVFDGCTFSDPQWEAVQITSDDLKSLTITNCVFTAADVNGVANLGYHSTEKQAIRYIHVQPSSNPAVKITITNNTFKDCENVVDSVVGVYFVNTKSTITVGGNTFEGWGDSDVTDGRSAKLSVGWPEVEELKTVAVWEREPQTFRIDKGNPTIN